MTGMSVLRTVLVTRPEPDAGALARRIESLGHKALVEPLLRIRFMEGAVPDLASVGAFAFTSANGVRALLHACPDAAATGYPVFAVGSATARAAREAGFARVTAAEGDVGSLARAIAAAAPTIAGAVLHVAGRERAGDLVGSLARAGIAARREVLYAAEPVAALSAATQAALAAGTVDDVAILSPRTARQFVTLIERAGLVRAAARLRLVALSPNVASAAAAIPFAAVAVAVRPTLDALTDLLAAEAGHGQT